MNARKVKKLFEVVKERAKLDFASVYADEYGDCCSCAWSEIGDRFGNEAKGIFAKKWRYGMNKDCSLTNSRGVWVSHDITEEQAKLLVVVCDEMGYNISPREYNESECFYITEKEEVAK